jgi:hypothetical protein
MLLLLCGSGSYNDGGLVGSSAYILASLRVPCEKDEKYCRGTRARCTGHWSINALNAIFPEILRYQSLRNDIVIDCLLPQFRTHSNSNSVQAWLGFFLHDIVNCVSLLLVLHVGGKPKPIFSSCFRSCMRGVIYLHLPGELCYCICTLR